jgi:hypothetical protein
LIENSYWPFDFIFVGIEKKIPLRGKRKGENQSRDNQIVFESATFFRK